MKTFILIIALTLSGCGSTGTSEVQTDEVYYGVIVWYDGDSGKLNDEPFRIRNFDSGEIGGVGAAIGGAECEQERDIGIRARDFMIALTENAAITVTNRYAKDRYDRDVLDISADGIDVASAGYEAGLLQPWPHDDDGNSLSGKPNWCS